MKKALKIVAIVLVSIVILAMLVVLGFKAYDAIKYRSFYKEANKEFYIPGLDEGFVPQGFDYIESERVFLACGYMSTGEASRVYIIDEDGDSYHYTELREESTLDYTGHTGGIAYHQNNLYITGAEGVDVFSLSDVLDTNIKYAYCRGQIKTYDVDPAFCYIYDGELLVGAFHKEDDYPTPESHHITTPAKDENKALMLSFNLVDSSLNEFGVDPTPVAAYSLPSYVQGACVTDNGKLVLSTSWGLTTSHLYAYDLEKVLATTNSTAAKEIFNLEIPLYYVDSASLTDTIVAPPMAEEIVYLDGKLWIFNESACNKYIFGKLTTGNFLFSIEYK